MVRILGRENTEGASNEVNLEREGEKGEREYTKKVYIIPCKLLHAKNTG